MGKLFNLDSPVMNFLSKLADLIWLNILVAVCCLPIFTIGASMTALHYVVLKMVRDEDSYITKAFFKSFKQNFKQATLIWLIMLVFIGIWVADLLIYRFSGLALPSWMLIALLAIGIVGVFATMHVFPILSRFDNTVINTFKNSLFMGILSLPKTITMMVCWLIPVGIVMYFLRAFPLVLLFGISGPALLSALLYNKTFKKFEPEEAIVSDEEWSIPIEENQSTQEDNI